jgi:hypothetical protein
MIYHNGTYFTPSPPKKKHYVVLRSIGIFFLQIYIYCRRMQQFLEENLWSTYQNARRYIPEDTSLKVSSFQKERLRVSE